MNERFNLDGEIVRAWLEREDRKRSYIAKQLCISGSLVDRMLGGHVPNIRTLTGLAGLMGLPTEKLLLSKQTESKRA